MYWHNHQTEFTNKYVDEGVLKSAIDIIMERTDSRYVAGEIDVKWSSDALDDVTGTKTAEYINKPAFGTRIQLLHIKDGIDIANPFPASAPHVATGSGEIDYKPIFAAAVNKVRYYHQEHDGGSLADGNVSLEQPEGHQHGGRRHPAGAAAVVRLGARRHAGGQQPGRRAGPEHG